jgi:hypothetical protein
MRLPVELHRDIIDLLDLPARALLSASCRYFAFTIKKPTFEEFLEAEASDGQLAKRSTFAKAAHGFDACFNSPTI